MYKIQANLGFKMANHCIIQRFTVRATDSIVKPQINKAPRTLAADLIDSTQGYYHIYSVCVKKYA